MDGNSLDSSGEGNNGVLFNNVSNATGRWSESYAFDGDEDFINITNDASIYLLNNLTVSVWIKWSGDTSGANYVIDKYANRYAVGLNSVAGSGAPRFYVSSTGLALITDSPDKISANEWHHIVGTLNGTNTTLYVDGVIKATSNGTPTVTSGGNLYFGCYQTCSSTYDFNGSIDEVRLYNRTLSAEEVKELYVSKGLIGHWTFDSKDGSNSLIAPDISKYNNSGTVTGEGAFTGPTFTNLGKFKEAYEFRGAFSGDGDYIVVPHDSSLDMGYGDFTIMAWAKKLHAVTDAKNMVILAKDTSWRDEYLLSMDDDGFISRIGNVSDYVACNSGADSYEDTNWHHVARLFMTEMINNIFMLTVLKKIQKILLLSKIKILQILAIL
jgi:hypothetical protein